VLQQLTKLCQLHGSDGNFLYWSLFPIVLVAPSQSVYQVAGRHPGKKYVFLISFVVAFRYSFSVAFSGGMTDKKTSLTLVYLINLTYKITPSPHLSVDASDCIVKLLYVAFFG
jgi:hypothetical protein